MGLRLKKSIKIAPGVRVNLGTKSAGVSFGGKGAHYSINSSGKRTTTVSIPGTGISYSSSSYSKKSHKNYSNAKTKRAQLERELARAEKEKQKQLELEHAKAVVEEYEAKIEAITTIHKACADTIPWDQIQSIPNPFGGESIGPREIAARKKASEYKPNIFAKYIRAFDAASNGALEKEISDAIEADKQEYAEWELQHSTATRVLNRDIDTMLEIISESAVFEELAEYGSGFEVGLITGDVAEVEFDIMANSVVPVESCSLTSTGKLSQKAMPVSKRMDIIQDYVCSCALRIARELFAILPINTVLIHAKDALLDTSVGTTAVHDILSVSITREGLSQINFNNIDPSDAMINFTHNMKFLKTKGFQPITRIRGENFIDMQFDEGKKWL